MKSNIGIFSFFAGAGFLDLGFEATEHFDTLFVNEFQPSFMEIYKNSRKCLKIHPPEYGYHTSDISSFLQGFTNTLLKEQLHEARNKYDIIGFIGGPPCPDFSIGGKNKGKEGENGKLSGVYAELICQMKPDFFLFENVKGLYRTKKHREFFDSLKLKLIKSGYYITEKLINAIEFGAPQDRERIILIGFQKKVLGDLGFILNGSPIIKNFDWAKNISYRAKEVFASNWPSFEPFEENSVTPNPKNIPVELTVEYWFKKNNVTKHPNAVHYFQPRAGLSKFLTVAEGDDSKKSYKRLHRWRYSPTAAYGNNEVHLHPYKARRISVAEALAIQSLPKEFIIPENATLTNMFKTIGNGVPYKAAKGLASNIFDFIYNNPIKDLKETHAKADSKQSSVLYQTA